MSAREIIVADVETSGLDRSRHSTVEVAWWHLGTGQRGVFVPPHNVSEVLVNADIEALRINRYIDRLATAEQDHKGEHAFELAELLYGNTLAGSTPSFDAGFLTDMFNSYDEDETGGVCAALASPPVRPVRVRGRCARYPTDRAARAGDGVRAARRDQPGAAHRRGRRHRDRPVLPEAIRPGREQVAVVRRVLAAVHAMRPVLCDGHYFVKQGGVWTCVRCGTQR